MQKKLKKLYVIFILYRIRHINQQQKKLDDCHFVYIHFRPTALDEALLAL